MQTRSLTACVALLLASTSWFAPAPPTAAGPGAVIVAVQKLLAAQSASNADAVEALLDTSARHVYAVEFAAGTDAGKLVEPSKEQTRSETMPFFDVTSDGAPIAGTSAHGATKLMLACGGKRTLRTIQADCDSPACSKATFTFDAEVREGTTTKTVAMRGTALLSYDAKLPGFRVFHWHASPSAR